MEQGLKFRQLSYSNGKVPLVADCAGPEEGTVVVLLHGFPDTPYGWYPVAARLVGLGYRVVMPWLRGYTRESAKREFEFGIMPAVSDLSVLMDTLGNPPAHLVGHDWGSSIAAVHANSRINQWLTVSLLAVPPFEGFVSSPLTVWRTMPAQLKLSSYMWDMQKEHSCEVLAANDCEKVRQLWTTWSPGWVFSEEDFAPVKAVFSDQECGWAATRYYRALFTAHKKNTWLSYLGAFGKMVHPVLALAGEKDGCMGLDFQRAMFAATGTNPGIITRTLPGCGHFLQAERPDEVAALLVEHIQAHGSISS